MAQLLPTGDEQFAQVLRRFHVPQDHGYEPGIVVFWISVDHDAVHAEDCCCPCDLADLERVDTRIPSLHGERGRDKDGSLAATCHQIFHALKIVDI